MVLLPLLPDRFYIRLTRPSPVRIQNLSLRFSCRKESTALSGRLTATMLRDHYLRELSAIKQGRRASAHIV